MRSETTLKHYLIVIAHDTVLFHRKYFVEICLMAGRGTTTKIARVVRLIGWFNSLNRRAHLRRTMCGGNSQIICFPVLAPFCLNSNNMNTLYLDRYQIVIRFRCLFNHRPGSEMKPVSSRCFKWTWSSHTIEEHRDKTECQYSV